MGRKKRWNEDMQARFPEGTFSRIATVLTPGEDRTDFIRSAVENELERRERKYVARPELEPSSSRRKKPKAR